MSSKDKSLEKKETRKDSSSEEHIESNYKSNAYKMLLDIEEKPEIIIEKILISIFNKYITPSHVDIDFLDLQMHYNKIRLLCLQQEESKIVYILLTKIRSLIKKYREKLFELPNIIELREKIFQKNYKRSYSQSKIVSKKYLNFFLKKITLNMSYPRIKKFNYYQVINNLFCELKNIRNCLRKTAPIIEKIFEVPLSKYAKFSIWECEKEDYLKILIHDSFIWNQIRRTNNIFLNDIINEITEGDNKNLSSITDKKINYFKLIEEYKKLNLDDILKISEISSSLDMRFPEDAKPLKEELYESIITDEKDMKYSFLDVDIDECTNSEEQNNDDINNIKEVKIYKALKKKIKQTKQGGLNKNILSNNINININNDKNFFNIPNLLKNNDLNNDKITSINKNIEIKNINKINKKKKKEIKKKEILKNENNKKIKIEKNDIPSDIDDLVKYIVNDDKTENQNKKKKRNKKRKKKNKNEIKEEKKGEIEEDIKEKDIIDDTDEIKKDFIINSINRFKIHKIKFKYRPKWLNKITKNS